MRRRVILLSVLLGVLILPAHGQMLQTIVGGKTVAGGGGGAFWSLSSPSAHTTIPSATISSTSADIDTSVSTVIIATVGYYRLAGPTPTLTDVLPGCHGGLPPCNTPIVVTLTSGPVETATQMYIYLNPIVGPGHNFSVTGGGGAFYFSGSVAAFKGSATPSFNSGAGQNGNSAAATSSTTGSVTPGSINNLIATGMTYNLVGGVASINGAFSGNITDQQPNGPGEGSALSWISQAGTGAANPTWTTTGTSATPEVSAHIVVIAP